MRKKNVCGHTQRWWWARRAAVTEYLSGFQSVWGEIPLRSEQACSDSQVHTVLASCISIRDGDKSPLYYPREEPVMGGPFVALWISRVNNSIESWTNAISSRNLLKLFSRLGATAKCLWMALNPTQPLPRGMIQVWLKTITHRVDVNYFVTSRTHCKQSAGLMEG